MNSTEEIDFTLGFLGMDRETFDEIMNDFRESHPDDNLTDEDGLVWIAAFRQIAELAHASGLSYDEVEEYLLGPAGEDIGELELMVQVFPDGHIGLQVGFPDPQGREMPEALAAIMEDTDESDG